MEPAELQKMQALLHQHLEALEHAVDSARLLERSLTPFSPQPRLSIKRTPPALEEVIRVEQIQMREETDFSVCDGGESPCPNSPHKSLVASGLSLADRLKFREPAPSKAASLRQGIPLQGSQQLSLEEGVPPRQQTSSNRSSTGKQQLVEPLLASKLSWKDVGSAAKEGSSSENQSEQLPSESLSRSMKSLLKRSQSESSLMHSEVITARSKEEFEEQLWKKKVKMSVVEKEDKLEKEKYKADGLGQRIRLSTSFNLMCFFTILANALWVGIQLDRNQMGQQQHLTSRIIDNLFCVWFVLEVVIWFFAFKRTRDAFRYWWFMVSAIIVALMVWTLWVTPLTGFRIWGLDYKDTSFLQVLRLTRIARLSRVFGNDQHSPQILFMATAIRKGMKATAPLLGLFSVVVYVFAIFLRWLLTDTDHFHFDTVPKAFHFLFWSALGNVDKTILSKMLDAGWGPWALFVAFTIIGNLTVAKMLTGLLLQVVMKLIEKEKEISDTVALEQTIAKVVEELDYDEDGSVSIDEFESLMLNRELLQSMVDHDVDVASFVEFTRTYFPADGQLFVADLVRSAKQFCGFKPASVKDVWNLRKLMYVEADIIVKGQAKLLERIQELMRSSSTSPPFPVS